MAFNWILVRKFFEQHNGINEGFVGSVQIYGGVNHKSSYSIVENPSREFDFVIVLLLY